VRVENVSQTGQGIGQLALGRSGEDAAAAEKPVEENELRRDDKENRKIAPEEFLSKLDGALAKLNEMTRIFNRSIKFSIHEESHRLWVRVIDTEENKVIREIPPEKILEMVARIQEFLGLLLDEKC